MSGIGRLDSGPASRPSTGEGSTARGQRAGGDTGSDKPRRATRPPDRVGRHLHRRRRIAAFALRLLASSAWACCASERCSLIAARARFGSCARTAW